MRAAPFSASTRLRLFYHYKRRSVKFFFPRAPIFFDSLKLFRVLLGI